MHPDECILIAGAGPVGIITGYYLARQGIPVKLFDPQAIIPTDHRAATLQPSTLDMVEELGMTSKLLQLGIKSPLFQYRDRLTGDVVAEFDYGLLKNDTQHPYALQVEQHKTIGVALELAHELPEFELRRSHTVTGITQTEDHVEVTVEDPHSQKECYRGRFLIGSDGGTSIVRKAMGIGFPGFTWRERFIIVVTPFDFAKAGGFRYRNYVAHPNQWCALMKVPGDSCQGVWRVLFPTMNDDSNEHVMGDEWIQARFQECLPYAPPYEIVHRNLFEVHQRVARLFRRGRVILAGDSAHVNNPIGGIGMNSGIHDGLNLAEKLTSIWSGEADHGLLALYDRQRRPMAKKYVQAQSIQNKETLQEPNPELRRRRLQELRQTAQNPARALEFMLRTSLIAMVREANSID